MSVCVTTKSPETNYTHTHIMCASLIYLGVVLFATGSSYFLIIVLENFMKLDIHFEQYNYDGIPVYVINPTKELILLK